jgi:hypothetical protein
VQRKPNPSWLMPATIVSVIVGTAWNAIAGAVLFIASVGVAVYFTRGFGRTPGLTVGGVALSDTCEACGGLLQNRLGSPQGVCPSCGNKQSWVK